MLRTTPSQPAAGRLLVTCAFAITILVAAVHADDCARPERLAPCVSGLSRNCQIVDGTRSLG